MSLHLGLIHDGNVRDLTKAPGTNGSGAYLTNRLVLLVLLGIGFTLPGLVASLCDVW